ncbi:MAG: cation:proton antiporter, partial [Kofleriaceae bacterium]
APDARALAPDAGALAAAPDVDALTTAPGADALTSPDADALAAEANGSAADPSAPAPETTAPTLETLAPDAGAPDAVAPDAGAPAAESAPPPEIVEAVEQPPPTTEETTENTLFAIKVIAGLTVLLVVAYLGGHRRVVRFQEQLGISGLITAGFPFVALGLIAAHPSIGILTEDVLARLRPVMHFGLGWLGFIIGTQLDVRVLDRVPKGTAYLILVEALGPFAITATACGGVMLAFGMQWTDPDFWRDAIVLGAAAAMTAPRKFRGFANRTWREGRGIDVLLGQFDEFVGVIGLLFITAYSREPGLASWQIPDTAWVFVSLGLGVAIGVLIFALIRVPTSNAEFLAVVLGGIAFASGLAGYLRLSPIVVCFIAGVFITNFPNDQRDSVVRILEHLERPVQLLFLIVAGAVWSAGDWRGWALVSVFVGARVLGKWTGMLAGTTAVGALLPPGFADQRRLVAPMSSLSIALVISVESLYHDSGLPWVTTAVIGGALVTELLAQAAARPDDESAVPEAAPPRLDETDEFAELAKLAEVSGAIPSDPVDEPPGGKAP